MRIMRLQVAVLCGSDLVDDMLSGRQGEAGTAVSSKSETWVNSRHMMLPYVLQVLHYLM